MKLAIANPSMISSSQDTGSRFLRRGGRCLAPGKPGLRSTPLARSSESPLQSSWSEAEDGDKALIVAKSTFLRRSRSRCERERRLCLKPPLRLGPSMSSPTKALNKNTPWSGLGDFATDTEEKLLQISDENVVIDSCLII